MKMKKTMKEQLLKKPTVITDEIYADLEKKFNNYVARFKFDDNEHQRNIELKISHTRRVCEIIDKICLSITLSKEERNLAKAIALFHDIGRFEQYQKYRTFSDVKSKNHAHLAVKVLSNERFISHLAFSVREVIIIAIGHHNKPELPDFNKREFNVYSKLIRDADKLDIFEIVTQYYNQKKVNPVIELNLKNAPQVSEHVIKTILAHENIDYSKMNYLNDFKLAKMAWVFDLNFKYTVRKVIENKYIDKIYNTTDRLPIMQKAYHEIIKYLNYRLLM